MRRVILILLAGAILVAAAWWVAGLPGTVAAQLGETSYEASVPVTILLLVVLFLVLHVLIRLITGLVNLPRRLRRARADRRRRQGDIAVTRTLVALAAGESSDARREVQRARRLLGDTPQTLLLTAEASRAAGRPEEADAAFRSLAERQDAAFLGLRGLLRDAIARGDWQDAAELARRAETAHPGATWLRGERWQLAIRTQSWKDALALAPADAPRAAFAAAAAEAEPDPEAARKLAKQAFDADPALPAATLAYARRLRTAGREGRAQDVLRKGWAACPQPEIAELALAGTPDPLARLRAAEKLVAANAEAGESRLLLGRLALEAGLTGEARRHADAARRTVNQPRMWMLLADVEEAERGETEAGRAAQRSALRNAATAGADPAWRCAQCGTLHAGWHPVCAQCGTPGRIAWAVPTAPNLLLPQPAPATPPATVVVAATIEEGRAASA